MNILITGTSGFIGQNLLRVIESTNLNMDNQIILLTSKKVDGYCCVNHKNYKFTPLDFELQNISNIDVVIHLGAFIPKSSAEADDDEKAISNITNTHFLYHNLPSIPKKFIFISTVDVYDGINEIITEDTPTNPNSLYGHSKLVCEKMLEKLAKKDNVTLQILRVGHIFGKGEDLYQKMMPVTINKVISGISPVIYSDGSEKRSFLNVIDCCTLILQSIKLDSYNGPINITSNKSITIRELVEMIIQISESKLEVIVQNKKIATRDLVFDNTKMNKYLGSETVSLEEGLREEYEYFRSKFKKE